MTFGPWDEPEDDEALEEAREEMEEFVEEAERNPFRALDTSEVENNPLFGEYEDQIDDARLTAFGMMDDSFDE